jgi:hypothetical protein
MWVRTLITRSTCRTRCGSTSAAITRMRQMRECVNGLAVGPPFLTVHEYAREREERRWGGRREGSADLQLHHSRSLELLHQLQPSWVWLSVVGGMICKRRQSRAGAQLVTALLNHTQLSVTC